MALCALFFSPCSNTCRSFCSNVIFVSSFDAGLGGAMFDGVVHSAGGDVSPRRVFGDGTFLVGNLTPLIVLAQPLKVTLVFEFFELTGLKLKKKNT